MTYTAIDIHGHCDERFAAVRTEFERNFAERGAIDTAIAVLRFVDEGKVTLDEPVATYWPEFAQAGKAEMPVRYRLTHQAGLVAVRKTLLAGSFLDWELMTSELAAQEP
jgi:CubicO group peptidase (beta-lactamase class C family)